MTTPQQFVPLRLLLPWPQDRLPLPEGGDSLLDQIGLKSFLFDSDAAENGVTFELSVLKPVSFELSFLSCLSLIIGTNDQIIVISGNISWSEAFTVGLSNLDLIIRFKSDFIQPVELGTDGYVIKTDEFGNISAMDIDLQVTSLVFNSDFEVDVDVSSGLSCGPFMIADTGIVVESQSLAQSSLPARPRRFPRRSIPPGAGFTSNRRPFTFPKD